ncbi:MAG: hypothetical protein ACRDZY_14450, partial [Acidimicrobiales bacterium]
ANPYSGSYLDEWERILTEGPAAAAEMLSSTSQRASDLRSASPFAGTLPEEERWAIIQATARVTQDATRRA